MNKQERSVVRFGMVALVLAAAITAPLAMAASQDIIATAAPEATTAAPRLLIEEGTGGAALVEPRAATYVSVNPPAAPHVVIERSFVCGAPYVHDGSSWQHVQDCRYL